MKRLALMAVVAAVTAGAFAAWGLAQPSSVTGGAAQVATPKKAALPPLPAEIKSRQRWVIGVKCDTPPFGYTDVRGKNAGIDVEIARWFARYAFGRAQRVTFVCAPTALREPLLTTNRVDLVISTFSYSADRDTRIDFSRAYYNATGRLLVKNDSPITNLAGIRGKRVATTGGSIYDRWMKRCFPTTEVIVVESVTAAVLSFNQGRADAVMFDDTSLALIAATDPNAKMTDDLFLPSPYGIGIKQGNVALKRWVDSRLELMRKKDTFAGIMRNNVAPRFLQGFLRNVLRPNNTFGYPAPGSPSADTICP